MAERVEMKFTADHGRRVVLSACRCTVWHELRTHEADFPTKNLSRELRFYTAELKAKKTAECAADVEVLSAAWEQLIREGINPDHPPPCDEPDDQPNNYECDRLS